ncbi:MAG TPA: glutamine synthetase family protein [Steroidobacteraceae bacterium]|nr:glutamine synthetase family protein [Steroidobacteraceae bacterium]
MNTELQEFLARHPAVDAVQLLLTDPSGVTRGKTLRRHELEALYAHGRNVAGSILGLDVTGADVEATGLVWEAGDADKVCRPVPGTLRIAPWLERTGQVMLSMYELDGAPAPADPRHCLVRAIESVAALGYRPVFACELEFYLLRREADGSYRPAGSESASRDGSEQIEAYSLARLDNLAALFREILDAATAQRLPAGTVMSEYAPGQFEITLQHRDDALTAVDEAVQFKRLIKGVASRHGLIASFMAKPFTQRAGSGAHLHLSLADREGRNAFASEDPAGTPLLRHAIAGMMASAGDAFLAFAPNGNSYRRFQRESYAPVAVNWGVNNRSVSLRVPAGPPASRHVEHRFCGADVNLYVAAAAVLAGAAMGIEGRLDPGAPVTGNGYAPKAGLESGVAAAALPVTWQAALERAGTAPFLRDALGAGFLKVYLAIKRQELARFEAEVTETDRAWYLNKV